MSCSLAVMRSCSLLLPALCSVPCAPELPIAHIIKAQLLRFYAINDFFSVILRNNFFYEIQISYSPDGFGVGKLMR